MLILKGGVCLALLAIAWQDFKYRAVYWWLFLCILLGLGSIKWITSNATFFSDAKYNLSFLGLQLCCLSIYFSVKNKRLTNIFKDYFGLGDLFFLLSISVYLSVINYILFYLFSLVVVMMISIGVNLRTKSSNPKIPLAGEQALLFAFFMIVDQLLDQVNLLSDLSVINYFNL